MNRLAALLLAVAVFVVLFADPMYAMCAALVAVATAWILDPPSVRTGLRFGVTLGIVFAASITAAVVTWTDGPERGLQIGGMMLLRLLVITVAAALLVRSVDADALLRVTRSLGLERLGLVLGLALNSLPRVVEAAGEVWNASSVRADGAIDRVRRLPGVGEVLLAHIARIAEEAAAAASLRGHSALTNPGSGLQVPVRVVVVTGGRDGGKTTTAIAVSERLKGDGVMVAGIVQPGVFEDGRKAGYMVRDLSTGEEAELARRGERGDGEFGTPFRFSDEGFRFAGEALSRATADSVVIIDELGPVELRGQGHMPVVRKALAMPDLLGAVIVVRRSLVPSLLADLQASDAVVIDIEEHGERSIDAIVGALNLV